MTPQPTSAAGTGLGSAPAAAPGSMRASAVSGGLWSLAQIVANKGLSLLGTVALLYLLTPGDYAIAGIALGIQSAAMVLPPFTLGDVLIARPTEAIRLLRTAAAMCAGACAAMALALLAAGPIAAGRYGQSALVAACACVALRPAVELALLGPQTRLRIGLRFRDLAVADALTQSLATVAAIAMAWAGMGWASLILPQVAATALRAWMYRRAAGPMPEGPRWLASEWGGLMRGYALSGLGQYVHAALLMCPPMVIAAFARTEEAGYFSSAFTLSTAINVIVSVSMGMVLQPIFAQMSGDPQRQSTAFMRACSTISAVAMPVCILQAALAGPAIRLLLPERWDGAIAMTAVLSLGQAFYFAVNPVMSLLKAQGRFMAFLLWQAVQLAVALGAMIGLGMALGEDATMPITLVAGLYTIVSAPVGVWICMRGSPHAAMRSALLFVRPLVASAAAILPAWVALRWLMAPGTASDIVHLAALPLAAALSYPLALRIVDPEAGREIRHIASLVRTRVKGAAGQ